MIDDREGEGLALDNPGEFFRRTIVQGTVRTFLVVVATPAFQFFARVGEMEEDLTVQTFVPQPAVEALDVPVLHRPAPPDEVQLHASW